MKISGKQLIAGAWVEDNLELIKQSILEPEKNLIRY